MHTNFIMSRRYKIYQGEFPYHVYNRTNNKESIFDLPRIYPIFLESLCYSARKTSFQLHHFVLMPNHYHLIGSTPHANLFEFMALFQSIFTKRINRLSSRINHVFGGRYGASVVQSEIYLTHLIRYLYQNPVKANLVKDPIYYSFSSLNMYQNETLSKLETVIKPDPYLAHLPQERRKEEVLRLSRIDLSDKDYEIISSRLKKPYFKFN